MIFSQDAMLSIFGDNGESWDNVVNFATLGLNIFWKQNLALLLPRDDSIKNILELGSGTGVLTQFLANEYPNTNITALDLSPKYLNIAKNKLDAQGIKNVTYVRGDAENAYESLPSGYKADLTISSYLAKYLDNTIFVKNINKLMNSGDILIIHEIMYPRDMFTQFLYNNHVQLMTLVLQVNPQWNALSNELAKIFINNQWINETITSLRNTNFRVKTHDLPMSVSTVIYAEKL